MIKVHIRRKVPPEKRDALQVLINQLRALTMGQPGYIAGETLKRVDAPAESLVVSKWQSTEYWKQWHLSLSNLNYQMQHLSFRLASYLFPHR